MSDEGTCENIEKYTPTFRDPSPTLSLERSQQCSSFKIKNYFISLYYILIFAPVTGPLSLFDRLFHYHGNKTVLAIEFQKLPHIYDLRNN
jgi:hypothetical protein